MKYIYLMLAATLIAVSAAAQSPRSEMESRHEQRVQQREVRHQNDLKFMDSVVLSRNFQFNPERFQQEPAGAMHSIYGIQYMLSIRDDYMDIDMPYIAGSIPPYRLKIINYITFDIQNYTAVQDEDGWTVSFASNLYTGNKYTFTLKIYSITREGVLNIASDAFPTVTYYGSVQAIY